MNKEINEVKRTISETLNYLKQVIDGKEKIRLAATVKILSQSLKILTEIKQPEEKKDD